jgi:DNA polymerase-3 subunit epsilon
MKIDEKLIKSLSKKIKNPIVCFDIESTGINTNTDEIVQFAAIRVNPNGSYEKLEFLCKPSIPIPKGASDVHGIKDEDVKSCKTFKDFIPDISSIMDRASIATYNGDRFDIKMLNRQLEANGVNDFFANKISYDAYKIYSKHAPKNLANALKHYSGKEIKDAHDALGDILCTIEVIDKQLEIEKLEPEKVVAKYKDDNRDGEERQYIVEKDGKKVLTFGKYKDIPLEEVDKGWLKWTLTKDFPESFYKEIKKYI